MGFYKHRESYLQKLSENHPLVQHNQDTGDGDGSLRRSFFRINDEEELLVACEHWIHFPCVVESSLTGGLANKGGSIRQRNINEWLFLTKMTPDPSSPFSADAITYAYDLTFDLMQDYINSMIEEDQENGQCGQFMDLDPANFKWRQVGPIADELYGWNLTFVDESRQQGITNFSGKVIFTTEGFAISTTE